MKKVFFGLIATVVFSVSGFATNVDNYTILKKEITSISIDGKSYSPLEFSTLSTEFLKTAKPCTVTTKITVQTPIGPLSETITKTFEATWWVCLLAKVAAFLASVWTPSI
jgi:hypothetical protein